ncbi:glycogen/starch/alpha-glucan phosphorylase [Paratractidigestivibacter sp.]|uniref:glycogen/starch/alpha-glucan phosphorylase n=1 Tax=Paratractidigestivibacter sp. TaxID=2847316 RepID=UPI003A909F88
MANIDLNALSTSKLSKPLAEATDQEIYGLLLDEVRERCAAMPLNEGKRKLYYISAELLIGKLLSNNLIDLGLFDDVREQLADAGHDLGAIEELEVEPSLGNGGLGRLAACFLDSIATLGLPGDGVGLNYHYGLFHQRFVDNQQAALPDEWLAEQGWLVPESRSYTVEFGDFSVTSRLYDIDVPGYGQPAKNRLRLFDLVGVDDGLVPAGSIDFDKTALAKNLTLFLYPDDSDADGRLLRIYQQYFMVSNAAQLIIDEALEKWPLANLQKVAPRMAEVIVKLDAIAKSEHDDPRVAIIDGDDVVHMAHIDIHFGYSINGVAALHTQILEQAELRPFYDIYPQKFSNKTNGITFRRWLMGANPELAQLVDDLIGADWRRTGDLTGLMRFVDDEDGNKPTHPLTIIFGGKAAPTYVIAQDIIHLVLTLSKWIAADPDVAPYLQVVMIENYNVTAAEHVIPAADVSEQISLASKEASGTSNMKFMLNGAVTLCTLDGANVEIAELVGDENIYTFGASSQQVEKLYADGSYDAHALYLRPGTKLLVDFITNPAFMATGNAERLQRLHDDMANKDWFMALLDIDEYIQKKEQVLADCEDRASWMRKALVNIAHAGAFSSDRTIAQYNDEIWHLK